MHHDCCCSSRADPGSIFSSESPIAWRLPWHVLHLASTRCNILLCCNLERLLLFDQHGVTRYSVSTKSTIGATLSAHELILENTGSMCGSKYAWNVPNENAGRATLLAQLRTRKTRLRRLRWHIENASVSTTAARKTKSEWWVMTTDAAGLLLL